MDYAEAKAMIDIDAAKNFRAQPSLKLDGLVQYLRQQIVDAEWDIARAKNSIEAYQAVIDKIEQARRDPTRSEGT